MIYVELNDLNTDPITVTRFNSAKDIECPVDRFAVEACFEHRDTITMGKLIAFYKVEG